MRLQPRTNHRCAKAVHVKNLDFGRTYSCSSSRQALTRCAAATTRTTGGQPSPGSMAGTSPRGCVMFDGLQVKRTQQAVRADRDEDVRRVERLSDVIHASRSREITCIAALDMSKLQTVYIMSIEVVTTRFNIFLVLRGLVKGGAGPVPWTAVRGKPARRVQGSECGKIKRR
jgi:hypothetical protein